MTTNWRHDAEVELWVDPKTFDQTCLLFRTQQPGTVPLADYRAIQTRQEQARQAQVIASDAVYVACKNCGSTDVVKDGVRKGIQYYLCKACRRKFSGSSSLPGMRFPAEQIATAITLFYEGLSLGEIRRSLDQIYSDSMPAGSTVYEWVTRFTQDAVLQSRGIKARTGTTWAADETVLDVAGGRTKVGSENTIWFWDVVDEETRFLLASQMSRTRPTKVAESLMAAAREKAVHAPRFIVTDKLRAYIDGIERVFGAETVHVQSQGLASESHNNLIERFHGTLKQRTKVMRGMANPETAKILLDGWLIHYNYFRPHESLRGETPGEAAQTVYPFKNWKDVVLAGVPKS